MNRFIASCLAAIAFVQGSAVAAQEAAAPAAICPAGQEMAIMRISAIKPEGSRAGFDAAMAQHMKWYRDHGYEDNEQVAYAVLGYDREKQQPFVAKDKVLTIHYGSPGVPADKRDAGWEAYVAAYKANSDIVTQEIVCLPSHD